MIIKYGAVEILMPNDKKKRTDLINEIKGKILYMRLNKDSNVCKNGSKVKDVEWNHWEVIWSYGKRNYCLCFMPDYTELTEWVPLKPPRGHDTIEWENVEDIENFFNVLNV